MPKLPQPSNNKPVPAGTYKVRVQKYEHGHSSKKGTPQITWTAEVIEPEEYSGSKVWDRTVMVETCLWRVANLLGACGLKFPVDIDTDSAFFGSLCQASLGRTAYWNVAEKTLDTGNTVNEVKAYMADEDQDPIEVTNTEETPAWIEEGGK